MIHVAQQGRAASQEVLAEALQGVLHLRPQPIQGEQGMLYFLALSVLHIRAYLIFPEGGDAVADGEGGGGGEGAVHVRRAQVQGDRQRRRAPQERCMRVL